MATVLVKNICAHYPYEAEDPGQPNLKHERWGGDSSADHHAAGLVVPAGVRVRDPRLNAISPTPQEIAQSMLLRQQAAAMVDARRTMVRGATETVRIALGKMSSSGLQLPPHALLPGRATTNLSGKGALQRRARADGHAHRGHSGSDEAHSAGAVMTEELGELLGNK
ncbi:MAG: hypothetical protein IPI67_17890 [Myxococcales bacterium]|nr:hypothetical protein [Myxococcales bacterium]